MLMGHVHSMVKGSSNVIIGIRFLMRMCRISNEEFQAKIKGNTLSHETTSTLYKIESFIDYYRVRY